MFFSVIKIYGVCGYLKRKPIHLSRSSTLYLSSKSSEFKTTFKREVCSHSFKTSSFKLHFCKVDVVVVHLKK